MLNLKRLHFVTMLVKKGCIEVCNNGTGVYIEQNSYDQFVGKNKQSRVNTVTTENMNITFGPTSSDDLYYSPQTESVPRPLFKSSSTDFRRLP